MLKRELARLKEENEILKKSGGVLCAGAAARPVPASGAASAQRACDPEPLSPLLSDVLEFVGIRSAGEISS